MKQVWREVEHVGAISSEPSAVQASSSVAPQTEVVQTEVSMNSKLGTEKDKVVGESSSKPATKSARSTRSASRSGNSASSKSDIQPDSSDVESSASELEEGEFNLHELELGYQLVRNKKKSSGLKFSGQKGCRGRGPSLN